MCRCPVELLQTPSPLLLLHHAPSTRCCLPLIFLLLLLLLVLFLDILLLQRFLVGQSSTEMAVKEIQKLK